MGEYLVNNFEMGKVLGVGSRYRDMEPLNYSQTGSETGVLFRTGHSLPESVREWAYGLPPVQDGETFEQVLSDVWYTDSEIETHVDQTEEGKVVLGLVLRNDLGLVLETEGQRFALPEGSVYRINGRIAHAAVRAVDGTTGHFVAQIWDIPKDEEPSPQLFAIEALRELSENLLSAC